MLNRRITPYLIALGILVLLLVSFLGYKAYQSHAEFSEFMSGVVSFQQSLDKDTQPDVDSTDLQNTQKRDNIVSPASGLATDQTRRKNTIGGEASQKPVKVRVLPPEVVALYSLKGDPHDAVRLLNRTVDIPDRTWTEDEMVKQLIELPDGKVIAILTVPGREIQENERVSLAYIENVKAKGGNHIEVDGVRHDISPEALDDEYTLQKTLWASSLSISVKDLDNLIANREFFVAAPDASLTPEELDINFKFLSKIPQFHAYVRAHRPDLLETQSPPDSAYQSSKNSEISGESDGPSYLRQLPLSESSPVPQGKIEEQAPIQSEPSVVSSQETESREGLSRAQQLIDQYGTEEGLRRLREVDPDAARQFERERKPPPARDESETQ